MNPFDLVVRHARVATAADVFDCDIGISGGRIVALAQGLSAAMREIAYEGMRLRPGRRSRSPAARWCGTARASTRAPGAAASCAAARPGCARRT
jgi:dihydroorotase-like cyclic amidohydrolase